ncbi:fimbrial protein [Escherichia coli]|jgi:type 1 fimbria pilin|uniref:fimbrial protein n=1 Tax=Escherichia coli TaxID=562 RepID=UPI000B0FDCEC|nr:fimbrial protein [Escherichia coli]
MCLPKYLLFVLLWGCAYPAFSVSLSSPVIRNAGSTSFSGKIVSSACALTMEDAYQEINLGDVPVRDLQNSFAGPEKRFRLRLRDCDLERPEDGITRAGHVRVTFDGLQGETPDKFSVIGQAEGINLQILDNRGYLVRVGKVMPALLLNGNEEGLDYTLRVVRNGQPLKAGDYYAAIRFKVDYE